MSATLDIAGRLVGPGYPCYVIAEAGVNHNGRLSLAKKLVDVAADAGADAVKFQTFEADRVASSIAPKAAYQHETTDPDESQLDMLRKLELSESDHRELIKYCQRRSIQFLSTPYDEQAVDLLVKLRVPAFKIGSGEIVNHPLLRYIASKNRPIILSTGTTYLSEVDEAVRVVQEAGDPPLALLHCVSRYPANPATMNLRAVETMAQSFQIPVGLSDHTLGNEISFAAVALGAAIIEKHFTLDRDLIGPDHRASLEPDELRDLVAGIRKIESAMGDGVKRPHPSESEGRKLGYRGLVALRPLEPGEIVEQRDLRALRTGHGISVRDIGWVVGRRLARPVQVGQAICSEDLV